MGEKPSNDPGDIIDLTGKSHSKSQMEFGFRNFISETLQGIESQSAHQPTDEELKGLPERLATFERHWNEMIARKKSDTPLEDLKGDQ
ncbi:MAG: hypothetical protein Q7R49_03655 [Candidatus Daviesbacteria bacterium]|nr:hypothetical protein [Candidatus Daviesbacteria bacterium]